MILAFFASLVFSAPANAFPELIRHGYTNCTSCHFSPNGGGVLTNYGRSLSKEVLATWSAEGEQRFMYLIKPQKYWAFGGDFRAINLWQKVGSATASRWIPMERNLEVAAKWRRLTAIASVGYQDITHGEPAGVVSRRHYLQYQLNDKMALRAGRFYPAFGIYIPEHVANIRSGLGWDQGQETYNVEWSYLSDKWNFYATGIAGRPDNPSLYREIGGAGSAAVQLGDTYKLGASYYYGANDLSSHHIFGPYAILGFSSDFFLLSQINGVRTYLPSFTAPQMGLMDYQKLGYEIAQGLVLFLNQQMTQTDLTSGTSRQDDYAFGFQFFPRPHFEIQTYFQKTYAWGTGTWSDSYALYLHFYP